MAENSTDQSQTSNQPEPVTQASDTQPIVAPQDDGLLYASDQPSTAPAGEQQPAAATTAPEGTKPEGSQEWDGKLETLPAALQPQYKQMLQHMHEVSQEAAAVKQKAQDYDSISTDPELVEFLQWKQSRQQAAPTEQQQALPQAELTNEELMASLNDPKAYQTLMQRQIQSQVAPVANQIIQRLQAMEYQMQHDQKEREIEAFANVHPDFYEIDPIVLKAALEDVVVQNKGTILDAYNRAKDVEKGYLDKARSTMNQTVQQKKAGVSATPSNGVQPEIVYAPDSRTANNIAAQYAAQGKQVDVRVRRK